MSLAQAAAEAASSPGAQVKMRARLGVSTEGPRAPRLERAGDGEPLEIRLVARVGARPLAGERPLVQLAGPLRLGQRLAQEGGPDAVGAGADPHADLARVRLGVLAAALPRLEGAADREHLEALAVQGQLELVGLDEEGAVGDDRDDVLGVLGEVEVDDHAPAGAEREPRDVVVLPLVGGDPERLGDRRGHRRPDREPADLPRRREVALHEGRRNSQHPGDVVEAVAGVVGRQEVAHVDVEVEEVADDVAVLGAAQPVQRLGPPRPQVGGGGAVELGLEPGRGNRRRRPARAGAAAGAASPRRAASRPPSPRPRRRRRRSSGPSPRATARRSRAGRCGRRRSSGRGVGRGRRQVRRTVPRPAARRPPSSRSARSRRRRR